MPPSSARLAKTPGDDRFCLPDPTPRPAQRGAPPDRWGRGDGARISQADVGSEHRLSAHSRQYRASGCLPRPLSSLPARCPPGLPFRLDAETIRRGLNFTLTTDLGALDLFGEIPGGGSYEDLRRDTVELTLFDVTCRCLDLRRLIAVKRAPCRAIWRPSPSCRHCSMRAKGLPRLVPILRADAPFAVPCRGIAQPHCTNKAMGALWKEFPNHTR